jgi:hypothetical protein
VRFAEGKKRLTGNRPRVQIGGQVRFAEGKKRLTGNRPRVLCDMTGNRPRVSPAFAAFGYVV